MAFFGRADQNLNTDARKGKPCKGFGNGLPSSNKVEVGTQGKAMSEMQQAGWYARPLQDVPQEASVSVLN